MHPPVPAGSVAGPCATCVVKAGNVMGYYMFATREVETLRRQQDTEVSRKSNSLQRIICVHLFKKCR